MKTNIYEFSDYKVFLNTTIERAPQGPRGIRRRIAEAMNCQVSHVTNVLSGPAHLSPEQADAAARFFGMAFEETEYLLLLIQENRASTRTLKATYARMLKGRRDQNDRLRKTLAISDHLTESQEATYYSSWHYSAIHVLLSIKQFQNREDIAARLGLTLAVVDRVLQFLVASGLCEKSGLRYIQRRPVLHLDRDSPNISRHHANWRLKAMSVVDEPSPDSFHYSGVVTLSKADFQKVRAVLSEALRSSFEIVKKSPEELCAALTFDYYLL